MNADASPHGSPSACLHAILAQSPGKVMDKIPDTVLTSKFATTAKLLKKGIDKTNKNVSLRRCED